MRPDNATLQLAPAQSGRKEAAKQGKKGFFGDTPNPGKGAVPLCTPPVMSGCQLCNRQCYDYILRCDWCIRIRIAHDQSVGVGAHRQAGAATRHIHKRACEWRKRAARDIDREPGGQ